MLRTELLRLAFILLLTLCFFHVSAQRLNEGDYDCDEQRLFSTYQEKDQEAQITDPEMLLHLGGLSFRLNRDTLGYEYYHRILEQPRLSNDVIYFQALLELKYRDGIAISSDSVRQLIKANYSEDHDIASAHIILETLSSLNPRPTIKVDSIILTHIDHIIDKQRFSTIIVKGRQEVAIYLADQGQLHRALDVAKQSFQFVRRHFPECSPSYYNSFINIGRRYINLDQPDSARYYFQQSLDHLLSFHPENHYLKYQAAFNLASAEKKLFTYTHALLYLEQAEKFIELDTVANSADHLSKIYNERAGLYYSMGKLERSKAAYLKSIQFSATASRGPSVPKIAAYANVASQLSFLNDYDNAIKYLQLALSNSNKLW